MSLNTEENILKIDLKENLSTMSTAKYSVIESINALSAGNPSFTDFYQDYIEPEELAGPILRDPLPFDVQIIEQSDEAGVLCAGVRFLSEFHWGQKIYMHGWLCHPTQEQSNDAQPAKRLPAVLLIPGGIGISQKDVPVWVARTCKVITLAVDWIGSGKSSLIPGIDPWSNAMRFDGDDYHHSYQYRNLRALLRATNFLLSQPLADPQMLMAVGGSWGGFYSWLLAGLDERFKYIFPTFGCGFLDTECSQVWESYFASMGREKAETWLRAFDPGRRAHLIKAKVFYQQATNDKFYSLLASMKTYHRVRSEKSLLLIRNQDHFTRPYDAQDIKMLRCILNSDSAIHPPVLEGASWVGGTNMVEIKMREIAAEQPQPLKLSVVYSGGNYTKSFSRYWHSVPATQRDGRWVAEIPVVDVNRELWFYAHADLTEAKMGGSTPVQRVIPAEMGLETPTAEYDPSFDFASDEFWNLPIGDRQHPAMRLVSEDGITGLAMRFTEAQSRRGIAYCLEGDLIAKNHYNAIEVMVKVHEQADLHGLKLVLVTDFHSLSEQTYVVELESYGRDFSTYRVLQIPFADFKPAPHRQYLFWEPPLLPLKVERLCGVGFYHEDRNYRGEAMMAKIRVMRMENAPDLPPTPGHLLAWPPRIAVLNEPDPLAVTGQGVIEADIAESRSKVNAIRHEPPADLDPYDFYVPTNMSAEALREKLQQFEPWRHEIIFSNGVRTTEFKTMEPFSRQPLAKWHVFKNRIPEEAIRGGKALDVGSNCGYHSFNLRVKYDMDVLGIDFHPKNLAIAKFLRDMSGLDRIQFIQADANTFRIDETFDLVVHFGTLDHLKNPMLALENTAAMMKRDGYFALELQTYKDPTDETLCKFIGKDFQGDNTCWWFPGKQALVEMLEECGFDRIEVLHEWASPERIGANMRRLRLLARKR